MVVSISTNVANYVLGKTATKRAPFVPTSLYSKWKNTSCRQNVCHCCVTNNIEHYDFAEMQCYYHYYRTRLRRGTAAPRPDKQGQAKQSKLHHFLLECCYNCCCCASASGSFCGAFASGDVQAMCFTSISATRALRRL